MTDRAWRVVVRGWDGETFWAPTRSAAKYRAAKALREATGCGIGFVFVNGFESVYLDHTAERSAGEPA
jgi:hypothetical protein